MIVTEIKTENFRNLKDKQIKFDSKTNIICGENAQGKTNLLEALWMFTGEKSFRGAKEAEFHNFKNKDFYGIEIMFEGGERDNICSVYSSEGKKKILLNGIEKKSFSSLTGTFCAVIFSPEHLSIIKGGPSERRNFIDTALCQIKYSYERLLFQYNRILYQRNSLLKDILKHRELIDTLDIWDEKLAQTGSKIINERLNYIKKIREPFIKNYEGISGGKENVSVIYQSTVNIEEDIYENLKSELKAKINDDIGMGFTSVGPHRDDIRFTVNDMSAREYASQGQQRSLILSLKFAEAEVLKKTLNESPILLLDDVMSELDKKRQSFLLNQINDYQIFITCCENEVLSFLKAGTVLKMKNGETAEG